MQSQVIVETSGTTDVNSAAGRQTDTDGPINRSSLTLESDKHLKTAESASENSKIFLIL